MRIRQAKIEDSKSIALLCRNTIKYVNSKDYTKSQIDAWLTKNTTKHMRDSFLRVNRSKFVMLEDYKIIGVVSAKLDKKEISGLYINRKYIGRKIGKQLLQKMEDDMLSKKISIIKLHSTITAFNFYKSQGYIKIRDESHIINGVSIPTILTKKNLAKK